MSIEYDVGCRSVIYGLYDVEECSLYSHFAECFYQKWCCTLSNAFSASIDMIMWFLSLLLFMWCITFFELWILYYPSITGINHTWSWCMICLMYCWMGFANILLRILALCSSTILVWSFLSLLCLYLVLGLGWCWLRKTSLGVFHLL